MASKFTKAKAEQAALKMSIFGPPGSGKTLTSLLVAEGLAQLAGKRVAFIDTEHGTDFYCQAVPERHVHPDAFDFDALYTRSLTEALEAVQGIDDTHAVIVVDSISHLWDAAMAAYSRRNRAGKIPAHAWGPIKAPYKALMKHLIECPQHVLILGRQANEFVEDEDSGEMKAAGVKMRAEGETQYEPHICIRMEAVKPAKKSKAAQAVTTAFVEKDRSSKLHGRVIEWPRFDNLAAPLLGLLGETQAKLSDEELAADRDAEALAQRQFAEQSRQRFQEVADLLAGCRKLEDLAAIANRANGYRNEVTATDDARLRTLFRETKARLSGAATPPPAQHQKAAAEDDQRGDADDSQFAPSGGGQAS